MGNSALLVVVLHLHLLFWALLIDPSFGFVSTTALTTISTKASGTSSQIAAKKAKSKKTSNNKKTVVTKGFGSAATSSKWEGCEDLQTWLIERGSDASGVSVGVVDDGGLRGVLAAKNFKRGDVLLSINRDKCIIDEIRADASPLAADIYPSANERNAIPPSIRVALYLLWLERNPTERQAWEPYLNSLPTPADFKEDGGPMELWSMKEVEQVQCGQLIAEVNQRSVDLQKLYQENVLPNWTKATQQSEAATSSLVGTVPPTFEEFQHAVCVVTSRSYDSMLVPGVDLFNHNDPPPHIYHQLTEAGDFLVTAAKNIAKGEESKTSYGPLPNRRLLGQFGFVLPGPLIEDTAFVRLDSLFSNDNDENNNGDNLPATVESEAAAEILWAAGPGHGRIQQLRAASTDSALRSVQRSGRKRLIARWQPAVSARAVAIAVSDSEEQGIDLYRGMVRRELASYSTSVEEDEAQLLAPKISPRMQLALLFRIQSKHMLLKEL